MFESVFGLIQTSGRGITRKVGLIIDEAKTVMYPEQRNFITGGLGMTIGGYTIKRRYKI